MAGHYSNVLFNIKIEGGVDSSWKIERFPDDSLSDLLERLSEKAKVKVEDFSFVYRGEVAKMEDGELRYFAETVRGETKVLSTHDRVEEVENIAPQSLLLTNFHILHLDDISCPPDLAPIISIDTHIVFFELDGSNALDGSYRALEDRQVVAWIEAYRLSNVRGEAGPVVLLHSNSNCVDVRSGEVFESYRDFLLASRTPTGVAEVEFGFILLRNKLSLPKWPIAPDLRTHIAVRDGTDFCIQEGLIEVRNAQDGDPSRRWIYPIMEANINVVPSDLKPRVLRQQIMDYISS